VHTRASKKENLEFKPSKFRKNFEENMESRGLGVVASSGM
jgi:hypothetical protein